MHKNVHNWIQAIRLPTLTASVIPVSLGSLIALKSAPVNASGFVLAVLAMTFFQIASNLQNDIDDFNNHVDTAQSLGSSRVIVDNLLTQKQVGIASIVFFSLAIAIGIYLSITSGVTILIIGLLGGASAYFYTGRPFSFKYRGLGIPLVFLMFGPLPVYGSYYLTAHEFSLLPILLSIPVGLLTTAILHANDLRDIDHDRKAGIKSLAMALGVKNARIFYIGLIAASFLSVFAFAAAGVLTYWSLLVLLSAPIAFLLMKSAGNIDSLRALDHKTAALQLSFGVLLLISVIV